MNTAPITERDFRKPEFVDADPNDYERRADGAIVRKDRWERGMFRIACLVGTRDDFEIDDIVEHVRKLVEIENIACGDDATQEPTQ